MNKTLFTNISPITNTYNNFNHFFQIKKLYNPSELYVCVWDSFVYEDKRFDIKQESLSKKELLKNNVLIIEKILNYLNINYKIIYFSESWKKLQEIEDGVLDFQRIMSSIKVKEIVDSPDFKKIFLGEFSISKINYTISDYLIACYLDKLYPEICISPPKTYLSVYTKMFERTITETLSRSNTPMPKIEGAKPVPIFIHPEKNIIPSMEMSYNEILKILKAYFEKNEVLIEEINDFLKLLANVLKENEFEFRGKQTNLETVSNFAFKNIKDKDQISDVLTTNLLNYFDKIKKIISNIKTEEHHQNLHITKIDDFIKYLKPLNELKLKILEYCNGKNSSLDISKLTGIKLSTVSTYLSQLKETGLVDDKRRPEIKIENITLKIGEIK